VVAAVDRRPPFPAGFPAAGEGGGGFGGAGASLGPLVLPGSYAVRVDVAIDRAFTAVNAQRHPIEAFSGLPTVDQRTSLDFAMSDAQAALAELDTLVRTDIPAAYRAVARKEWPRRVSWAGSR
jgi:hypothetical protein